MMNGVLSNMSLENSKQMRREANNKPQLSEAHAIQLYFKMINE